MIKLNKNCKDCIHEVVCEYKILPAFYEEIIKDFYDGLGEKFAENFDLIIECKHHVMLFPQINRSGNNGKGDYRLQEFFEAAMAAD